jgi:hypothetical protein
MTAIALGDITIHPVIEQQGTWFDVLEFSTGPVRGAGPRRAPTACAAAVSADPGDGRRRRPIGIASVA